ncbi:MAG: glycosyltransferase family 4 protein [Verrucomicrobiales bacterium]|nr:glycosyltransferase family 4 protein [Verrucomicrobiales bacterium]
MTDKTKMKVVIVHYHLRRGGVSRVIDAAQRALIDRGHDVLVISGEAPTFDGMSGEVRVLDALDYRNTGSSVIADSLTEALKAEARAYFGGEPDVWHFHNPTLAKNVMFPTVIRILAEEGARIVLQLHDFSEDGRPGNYSKQRSFFDSESGFEGTLYPTAKQIHYATINHRDFEFLRAAGVSKQNLHVLPNAITEFPYSTTPADRPFSKDRLFALYPTRGIRRKNIGELLLLALIYGDKVDFATTLNPENPEWMPAHEHWSALIEELELPVDLGISENNRHDFLDLVGWADFFVTTSVAEGFGLAFLEPWVSGKAVIGRDLPGITKDFEKEGVDLGNLYERIDIPVDWFDVAALKAEIESVLRRTYLAYDVKMPKSALKQTWKAWVRKGKIDFGVLNETFQTIALRKLKENPDLLKEVGFPALEPDSGAAIESRARIIREVYSPSQYGERLEKTYLKTLTGHAGKVSNLSPKRVLDQFLDPARLNLLRH